MKDGHFGLLFKARNFVVSNGIETFQNSTRGCQEYS